MTSKNDVYVAEPRERYRYFIETVATGGELWGLWADDTWVVRDDPEGRVLFLLWPSADFANRSLQDFGAELPPNAVPEAIPLRKWIEAYTPDLIANKDWPCVFPDHTFSGVIVAPGDLRRDLEHAFRSRTGRDVDRTQ